MKILKTVQKVPGGMMVIPLLLGVVMQYGLPLCPAGRRLCYRPVVQQRCEHHHRRVPFLRGCTDLAAPGRGNSQARHRSAAG